MDLAQANSDGVIVPAVGKTFTISTVQSDVLFYSDSTCSSGSSTSTSVTFAVDDIFKQVYYRIPAVPSGGISNWRINDGSTNWQFDYFVKSNN